MPLVKMARKVLGFKDKIMTWLAKLTGMSGDKRHKGKGCREGDKKRTGNHFGLTGDEKVDRGRL